MVIVNYFTLFSDYVGILLFMMRMTLNSSDRSWKQNMNLIPHTGMKYQIQVWSKSNIKFLIIKII